MVALLLLEGALQKQYLCVGRCGHDSYAATFQGHAQA